MATVTRCRPIVWAIAMLLWPSALNRTIRARWTKLCDSEREFAIETSCRR
ncbi:MAG TPA: hypothetical protein VM492_06635 [Sumerlaeia bacterium]|nr:hypothetical protein [Sumerlaeia bacterium]